MNWIGHEIVQMSAKILDGNTIGNTIRQEVREEASILQAEHGVRPGLATILVGDHPASQVYVSMKRKACIDVGIETQTHELPSGTSDAELLTLIKSLNADVNIHGILVQHPLPDTIDEPCAFDAITPDKDVDGVGAYNLGRVAAGHVNFASCTPAGIIELLDRYEIPIEGKDSVVVGRSRINGRPAALLLTMRHATVTLCHTRTKDLAEKIRGADLLIAAMGVPEAITADMVKPDAVVIDTGYNRLPDRKGDVGDVHFNGVREIASFITPVPGGVGPMTIAMLLKNTLEAAKRHVV